MKIVNKINYVSQNNGWTLLELCNDHVNSADIGAKLIPQQLLLRNEGNVNPLMPTVAFSQPIFVHGSNIFCPRD